MKIFIFRIPMLLMVFITSILITLKLNDNISWSWDDVFLPLQLFVILGAFLACLYVIIEMKRDRQKNK